MKKTPLLTFFLGQIMSATTRRHMKNFSKSLSLVVVLSLLSLEDRALASEKAIINADYASDDWHQAANYSHFLDRAPTDWVASVAGTGGGGIPGEGWDLYSGGDMIRRAADEGFAVVMHYGGGAVDPQAVLYAANQGCAVFSYHASKNARHYADYRSHSGSPILGRGPTPMLTVSGGYSTSSQAIYVFGPQAEFIDAIVDGSNPAQSWAHSATAARYARLKNAYSTWNVYDLRQLLRQACSFYDAGWREDGGYGFPLVANRTGNSFSDATINGKVIGSTSITLADLDAGPPLQPSAKISTDGNTVTFRWYNFRQTEFASTVVKVNGVTLFDGDAESYEWTPTTAGTAYAEFFTKLTDARMSRSAEFEQYTKIKLRGLVNNVGSCATLVSGELTTDEFSFVVTGPIGSRWNVYQSEDLSNWTLAGGVTLDDSPAIFTDSSVNGVGHRFYRAGDGTCCSQAFGFTRVTAVPGQTLIANQLDAPANTLSGLFSPAMADGSALPDGTEVGKWNGSGFDTYTFSGGSWSPHGNATMETGEGVFLYNPTQSAFTLSLVGLVQEGQLSLQIASGQQCISSLVPQYGGLSSALGYSASDGDSVQLWDAGIQAYEAYTYISGLGWYDGAQVAEPVLGVGEGFFLNTQTADVWERSVLSCGGQIVCDPPTFSQITSPTEQYTTYTYVEGEGLGWFAEVAPGVWEAGHEPEVEVGEGFWLNSATGIPWTRSFTTHPGFPTCAEVEFTGTTISDSTFTFSATGPESVQFDVETSEDLVNWQSVDTIVLGTQPAVFTDNSITEVRYRFYRLTDGDCYSRSIGFTRVRIKAGTTLEPARTLIASQLETGVNTLDGLFTPTMVDGSELPDGTAIEKWDGQALDSYTYSSGSWTPNGDASLAPGEAVFVVNSETFWFTVSFVGLVPEGDFILPLTSGQQYVSLMIPQRGGIESAGGYPSQDGDEVNLWDNSLVPDASLTENGFAFEVNGAPGSHWLVHKSEDLSLCQPIQEVTIGDSGTTVFTDNTVGSVDHRFYLLSNGDCISEAIGFTRVTAVPGQTLIANQLDAPANTLSGLFSPVMADGTVLPDGAQIRKWNGSGFDAYTFSGGAWSPHGNATVEPGEGVFLYNPTQSDFPVSFVGFVQEGQLNLQISSGQQCISSLVPQGGGIGSALGYDPYDGDAVQLWNTITQGYDTYSYISGFGWYDGVQWGEPEITVGEGFFLNAQTADTWEREFFVCD